MRPLFGRGARFFRFAGSGWVRYTVRPSGLWPVECWTGGRVAEGAGLLNRYTRKTRIAGSNPALSASQQAGDASRRLPVCFAASLRRLCRRRACWALCWFEQRLARKACRNPRPSAVESCDLRFGFRSSRIWHSARGLRSSNPGVQNGSGWAPGESICVQSLTMPASAVPASAPRRRQGRGSGSPERRRPSRIPASARSCGVAHRCPRGLGQAAPAGERSAVPPRAACACGPRWRTASTHPVRPRSSPCDPSCCGCA